MKTARYRPHLPLDVFTRFVRSQAAGSVLLLAGTVAGLLLANSRWSGIYLGLLDKEVGVSWGPAVFALSLKLWINDLLMAVFFFIVGLEIKRELVAGHLSSPRKALLPVAAAFGGMVVPALIYSRFNPAGATAAGWGIPMATDIAFALGVLAVFGRRVPIGLKVFLTALAIVDDLGAVLVIAVFYTQTLNWPGLVAAVVFLLAIAQANRSGIRHPFVYVVLAIGVWGGVLTSGIHATVAGVLVAMLVPVRSKLDPQQFLALTEDRLARLRDARVTSDSMLEDRWQLDAISDLRRVASEMRPPGLALEETFHNFVAFAILPLFAFFNAGVAIEPQRFLEGLRDQVSFGVIVGLVVGKQVGITLFSWLAVRFAGAEQPAGVGWSQLYGGAVLGGIGFTMSIFVTELAFNDEAHLALAKVGVLVASIIAAAWGAALLAVALPRAPRGLAHEAVAAGPEP